MTEPYALVVQLESHEYYGEFYLVGEGYGTPAEVLENVAGDHLLRISDAVEPVRKTSPNNVEL
jgi:hypothetical protein